MIIELYFGLNGKEKTGVRRIGRMIGLKQSEVKKYVDYIAQFIKKELGNKKNDFDFNYDHEVNQHKGKLLK